MIKKTWKCRLYPKLKEKEIIDSTIESCRWTYNHYLAERKDSWESHKLSISKFDQIKSLVSLKKEKSELNNIYAQTLQNVASRVHETFKNFFRKIKNKEKCSYPRFKQFGRYHSFAYPQNGFKIENEQLILSKIGRINIRNFKEIDGKIKTCSIFRKNDKYYACFSLEVENKILPKTNKSIGIDLGVEYFLASSNGELVVNPKYLKQSKQKLELNHQAVSQRKKGSNRRKKVIKILSNCYEKVSNQRRDFLHKLSRKLINDYDFIAIEDLKIKSMIRKKDPTNNINISFKKSLNKNINDVSWRTFANMLTYKAEDAGRLVIKVDCKNTSQICSSCNTIAEKKLTLKNRIFKCIYCNYQGNRDINASINILNKAKLLI